MAHHKRHRPKSTRAGCKPHKRQGSEIAERDKPSLRRKIQPVVEFPAWPIEPDWQTILIDGDY